MDTKVADGSFDRNAAKADTAPVKVTDGSFDQDVLKADKPVVVDFWAEWCGPCHAIAPALEELASELGGQITIAKLNIDENPQTTVRYGVRSIPTLIMFKNGEPMAIQVGAAPKSRLSAWISKGL
ncbi:MAG: thioredoxin [Bauldia sp.]|nr:thioredoxin [Bauldia sp.]